MNTLPFSPNPNVNPIDTQTESRAERIARVGITGGLFVAASICGVLGIEQQSAGDVAGAAAGWIGASMLALAGIANAKQEALANFCNDIVRE